MTSTDASQMNFNPSWMQSTAAKNDKPNGMVFSSEEDSAHELMDPVFANYRYGREDILALMTKDVKPPDGLDNCQFFVEKAQTPIILLPLNETELRLQQNINSSKALSVLSRQDRNFLNGSDSANSTSKWTVAGGNRTYNPSTKPISNRWNALGSSAPNNDGGGGLRSTRTGPSFFTRTGTGIRTQQGEHHQSSPPKTFNPRFRQSAPGNDTSLMEVNAYSNSSAENTPIPSTSTGSAHNPWTKVGSGKTASFGADTMAKTLKSSGTSKMSLEDLPGGGPVRPDTKENLQNYEPSRSQQSPSLKMDMSQRSLPAHLVLDKQPKTDIKWSYLDPIGLERGPFDSRQMQTWFENGYFDSSLRISKAGSKKFITLGELFQINGAVTPFIVKGGKDLSANAGNYTVDKPQNIPPHSQIGTPTVITEQTATSIWSNVPPHADTAQLPSGLLASDELSRSLFKSAQELNIDKLLQEKQMAIAEKQRKLREKEEQLLREERERIEKEQLIMKRELELQRKQEELQRIAREKEKELEKKRLQVAEFERQRREALEKIEEKLRTEQLQQLREREEERLRFEAEAEERRKAEERRISDEQRRRREEEEANMRAAYEEARRLKEIALRAEEEQRKALLAEEEARKKKEREEKERALALEQQKKREKEERALAEKRKREEEAERARLRQLEEELSKAAIQEILNADQAQTPTKPKASPWVTVGGVKTNTGKKDKKLEENRGKSLLEIQREEELAHRENLKKQQEELRKNAQATTQQSSGPWAKAEKNISWNAPSAATPTLKQGGLRTWNNVTAPIPAEIPKAQPKESKKATQKKQLQATTKKTDLLSEKSKTPDAFTAWIIKRVRELNSSVDAEVFATFIEGVDSPDEVEDYVIGYLGESKAAKEFHREFLIKRIELRPRVLPSAKDDLSCPAVAASDATCSGISGHSATSSNANNSTKQKKKKGKAQKIDPTVLSFRATGDPNRFNAGEIDTAPPMPTRKR